MALDNDKKKSNADRNPGSRVGRASSPLNMVPPAGKQKGSASSAAVNATSFLAVASVGAVAVVMSAQTWSNVSVPLGLAAVACGSAAAALGASWVLRSVESKLARDKLRRGPVTDGIASEPVRLVEVLRGLVALSESRDAHTGGHCQRVVDYSLAMGRAHGLGASELDDLYWAALLHDIGKVTVPESILLKAGRLTEEELAEIRRHPAYGSDLIASLSPRLEGVARIVCSHHERWDGRGYPAGIAGEAIPLAARILAIADVFEALTTERPYRKPLTPAQAAIYIRRGAGTQFDPELVGCFERVFAERRLTSSSRADPVDAAPVAEAIRRPS